MNKNGHHTRKATKAPAFVARAERAYAPQGHARPAHGQARSETEAAQTGRLVVFPPYWMYQHEGIAPVSGDKYILSTYLLFTESPGAAAQAS